LKHFEVVIMRNGAVNRKGVIAADIVAACEKALTLVPGATIDDVERATQLGVVDAV
jgi:hypothetical protein